MTIWTQPRFWSLSGKRRGAKGSFCYFPREKETVHQRTWIDFQGYGNWRDCCFWADICLLRVHMLLRVRCGWMSLGRRVNMWQNWLGQAIMLIKFYYIPFIQPETWRNKMSNIFHILSSERHARAHCSGMGAGAEFESKDIPLLLFALVENMWKTCKYSIIIFCITSSSQTPSHRIFFQDVNGHKNIPLADELPLLV